MAHSQTHNKGLSHGKEFDRLSLIFFGLTSQKVESFFFPGLKKRYKNGNGSAVTTTRNGEKLIITYRANIKLAELDTVILASDGLWDNVYRDEVAELVSNRSLTESANGIFRMATERMRRKPDSEFGKPDDLSFILYRPHRRSTSTTVQLDVN